MKEEFCSLEQFSTENGGSQEVKRLISEGKIRVFREENQVKLSSVLEEYSEKRKRKKRKFSEVENSYYTDSTKKFKEECWTILAISTFLSGSSFWFYSLFPSVNSLMLKFGVFFLALAQFFFVGSIAITLMANSYFSRFLILLKNETKLGDKKTLLTLFTKGYARKLTGKILWFSGLGALVFFLFFFLLYWSLILSLAILAALIGFTYWIYLYIKMIEKTGVLRIPRRAFPLIEEDVSNIFPGASTSDGKGELQEKLILTGVVANLKSTSLKVRHKAIKSLARIGSTESIQILIGYIGDPIPETRAQAVNALGKTGEKFLAETISHLLNDEEDEVRAAATEALGNLKEEKYIKKIISMLDDSSQDVRGAAAEALGNLKKKSSLKYLIEKLDDKDWFVRHKIVIALGKIKSELSIEGIEKLMKATSDENDYVASSAKHVLKKLADDMSQQDPLYDEVTEALHKNTQVEDESTDHEEKTSSETESQKEEKEETSETEKSDTEEVSNEVSNIEEEEKK